MPDNAHVVEITRPSDKKIEANRRNAKLSTGPRTESGKNRSRYNAIKHGIFSRDMLRSWGLGKEDTKEFDNLLASLLEDLKPVGAMEEILVERIAVCLWRLKRVLQYEVGTMQVRYNGPEASLKASGTSDSEIEFLTAAFRHLRLPQGQEMDLLLRYETTFHRQLLSTLNQVERLQRARTGERIPAPLTVQVVTD
jgi:hypothetical protein